MSYNKRILHSAKGEKKWLCETYGGEFCQAFEHWCNKIVEHAPENPGAMLLIPLEDILDEAEKPWSYVWRQLKDRTITDRLKSLLAFIRDRKPPFELLAVQARFHVQNTFWVNVISVVEIDRVSKSVTFT